ncbi:DUF6994 family protein [Dellaglioa algida]|uniref:DUF6994 family protein n=1 Tax=Dellaglioa algida TaxID=105612 RepID=UPI000BCDD5F7|nr:hypothetical protein [Dellaglioa algida]MDK1718321.1 hypothetical protein [Dellaglioa algida]MDK1728106.1 hypothetical protein [Dellaglioa algida]MDK1729587.1 hypothetical protein [Dellaglioa algida]MDK1735758.1 hypothetical protein [Dellaglioa algida]MDK1737437.1 hypothetical protein [Dellaglioa algida]
MKLDNYIGKNDLTVDDFLKLDEKQAIKFDFLTQGDEADRTNLNKGIYHKIFPWYNEEEQNGDTLNTYRIAIKKYYGSYYRFLNRDVQLEIIDIIKKYTLHDDNQLFEFEAVDGNGNAYFQVCNNYQLGNFGILPIRGGINPKRAQNPYLDYFDQFLYELNSFYEGESDMNGDLQKSILDREDYFNQFNNLEGFIEKNLLWDFLETDEDDNLNLKYLSDIEDFEEYISAVTDIIYKRGRLIYRMLHGILDELNVELSSTKKNLEKEVQDSSVSIRKKYSVDKETAEKLAKVIKYRDFLETRLNLYIKYDELLENSKKENKTIISKEENDYLEKKFEWTRWWYWIILFCVISFIDTIVKRQPNISWSEIETIHNFLYLLFWGSIITKIIYNVKYYERNKVFEAVKVNKLDNLHKQLENNQDKLLDQYNEKLAILDDNNEYIMELGGQLPAEYQNYSDAYDIIENILDGKVDTFKESYEKFENDKHRRVMEEEAMKGTVAAEEVARMQQQAAQANIDNAKRQSEIAEQHLIETERHNREVEYRQDHKN